MYNNKNAFSMMITSFVLVFIFPLPNIIVLVQRETKFLGAFPFFSASCG